MLLRISKPKLHQLVFFLMMWVFFSLNSAHLSVPKSEILRWLLLGLLILSALLNRQRIVVPYVIIPYLAAVIPSVFYSLNPTESVLKIASFVAVLGGSSMYFFHCGMVRKWNMQLSKSW